jgi:hypothetical protein
MRGLFMSIHLFSIVLILILVGVYAPIYWSVSALVLFFGSLLICETCKNNAKKSVTEIKKSSESKTSQGLVILSKTERALKRIRDKKKK